MDNKRWKQIDQILDRVLDLEPERRDGLIHQLSAGDDELRRAVEAVLSGEPAHTGPTWRATINQGLAKHTYATIEGGITEEWARDRMRKLGVIATLVTVDSHEQGIQWVAERKADAFFGERMLLQTDLRKRADADQMQVLDTLFGFMPVSFPIERGDEDFRLLVDTVISELYRSGDIVRVHRQYLGELREGAELLFPIYALP